MCLIEANRNIRISGMHKPQFVVLFSVLILEHEGLAQTVEPSEEGIGNQLKY